MVFNAQGRWQTLLISGLAVLVVVLAILQYRWLSRASENDLQILKASEAARARDFHVEFNHEINRAFEIFQISGDALSDRAEGPFAERVQKWNKESAYPSLIKNVFFATMEKNEQLTLKRFDAHARQFEEVDWPSGFAPLLVRFQPRLSPNGKVEYGTDVLDKALVAGEIPAIVRPVPMPGPHNRTTPHRLLRFNLLITELDADYIKQILFPGLLEKHFSDSTGLDYRLVVTGAGGDADAEVYQSGGPPAGAVSPAADKITFDMFHLDGDPNSFEQQSTWKASLQRKSGSLMALANQTRTRNLIISFGILGLLTIGMILIVFNTRRAQQLARQQLEFVAGVSHEFRTPLTVIHALGENLADGLVVGQEQVEQCGIVIRNDVRRLSSMVEQTLEFAGALRGRALYHPRPVDVSDIIDEVLEDRDLFENGSPWHIEKNVDGRPVVMADSKALASALRNIVQNAVKYSSQNHWIGVNVSTRRTFEKPEVVICVEDKGLGISAADLPHIFEPFYRGRKTLSAQIHGSGLGLSLVKNIVEAHGGSVIAESTEHLGSSFTLILPAAMHQSKASLERICHAS